MLAFLLQKCHVWVRVLVLCTLCFFSEDFLHTVAWSFRNVCYCEKSDWFLFPSLVTWLFFLGLVAHVMLSLSLKFNAFTRLCFSIDFCVSFSWGSVYPSFCRLRSCFIAGTFFVCLFNIVLGSIFFSVFVLSYAFIDSPLFPISIPFFLVFKRLGLFHGRHIGNQYRL